MRRVFLNTWVRCWNLWEDFPWASLWMCDMIPQVCIMKTFLLLITYVQYCFIFNKLVWFVFWLFYLPVEETFCTCTLDSLVSPSLPMESLSHDSDHVRFCIVVIRVMNIIECYMENNRTNFSSNRNSLGLSRRARKQASDVFTWTYQMFKFLTWRQVDGVDLLVKSLAIAISL